MNIRISSFALLAAVLSASLRLAAANGFCLDLSGEWTCAGTNFTGKARLPGTLADVGLGTLQTPAHFAAYTERTSKTGEHRMEIAIDNTAQYGAVMKAHGFGEWMQSVWNGAIGRIELREANPLGVVSR